MTLASIDPVAMTTAYKILAGLSLFSRLSNGPNCARLFGSCAEQAKETKEKQMKIQKGLYVVGGKGLIGRDCGSQATESGSTDRVIGSVQKKRATLSTLCVCLFYINQSIESMGSNMIWGGNFQSDRRAKKKEKKICFAPTDRYRLHPQRETSVIVAGAAPLQFDICC